VATCFHAPTHTDRSDRCKSHIKAAAWEGVRAAPLTQIKWYTIYSAHQSEHLDYFTRLVLIEISLVNHVSRTISDSSVMPVQITTKDLQYLPYGI